MNNAYLQGRVALASRVVEDLLEYFEEGGLEHHCRHFAVPRDAVEHFGDAVVGQRGIGSVVAQHEAIGVDDFMVGKPGRQINNSNSNLFNSDRFKRI